MASNAEVLEAKASPQDNPGNKLVDSSSLPVDLAVPVYDSQDTVEPAAFPTDSRRGRGNGTVQRYVLPYLDRYRYHEITADGIVAEVASQHGITLGRRQVHNVIIRARAADENLKPSDEDIRIAKRMSHIGKPSCTKGTRFSGETIRRIREQRRKRQLTQVEQEQTDMYLIAREIPGIYGAKTIVEIYQEGDRLFVAAPKSKEFLEIYYGAMVSSSFSEQAGNLPSIEVSDMKRVYRELDPFAFYRLYNEIAFLHSKVPVSAALKPFDIVISSVVLGQKRKNKIEALDPFDVALLLSERGASREYIRRFLRPDRRSHKSHRSLKNSLTFARRLIQEGFITSVHDSWRLLWETYLTQRRTMPDDFSMRLILEAFFKMRVAGNSHCEPLLDQYVSVGEAVDRDWFDTDEVLNAEQYFITNTTARKNSSIAHSTIFRGTWAKR